MAEDHRRVEPRSIVGTGMATDPERLDQIRDDAARRERASRPHELVFGAVLQTAPARGSLEDAFEPDARKQPAADAATEGTDAADSTATAAPDASSSTTPAKKPLSSKPKPSLPDPRERLLRARMAALEGAAKKMEPLSSETPPTGNSRVKK